MPGPQKHGVRQSLPGANRLARRCPDEVRKSGFSNAPNYQKLGPGRCGEQTPVYTLDVQANPAGRVICEAEDLIPALFTAFVSAQHHDSATRFNAGMRPGGRASFRQHCRVCPAFEGAGGRCAGDFSAPCIDLPAVPCAGAETDHSGIASSARESSAAEAVAADGGKGVGNRNAGGSHISG